MAIEFLSSDDDIQLVGVKNLNTIANVFSKHIAAPLVHVEFELVRLDAIRQLNLEQREVDSATDVLSFPLFNALSEIPLEDMPVLLGSVIICPEKAEEYAETLPQLLVHGILHLMGFDHELNLEQWLFQERIILEELASLGLKIRGIEAW